MPAVPRFQVPPHATDCHFHVFGPAARYRFDAARVYTPPDALLGDYRKVQRATGLERMVFVQPSPYGTDNTCMLDAMAECADAARGVAVIPAEIAEAELARLHAAGVRGVRVNIATVGGKDPEAAMARVRAIAERIAPHGWHVQVFIGGPVRDAMLPRLGSLPVSVVIDHQGLFHPTRFEAEAGWADFRRLIDTGRAWVKVSGADRVVPEDAAVEGAVPLMRAIIEAAPERTVWGTDWPHTGHNKPGDDPRTLLPYRDPDDRRLLAVLAEACPDEAAFSRVLVANPARLYGFA